jgi:hypothetical protein
MPSYQVNPLGGVLALKSINPVPAKLCCEQCMVILHEFDEVEPSMSRLSNVTAIGVLTLWPELEDVIVAHESDCRRLVDEDDQ